jgi:type I site-specific restriction-modification system R (restriction) subunit
VKASREDIATSQSRLHWNIPINVLEFSVSMHECISLALGSVNSAVIKQLERNGYDQASVLTRDDTHVGLIETAQVIEELIELAKEMREANQRGEQLNLTEDEVAFYDSLETNDSAVQVLGDETLRIIARELVEMVRRNVAIDWTVKESARARLRVMVRRILRKYGYPPDK